MDKDYKKELDNLFDEFVHCISLQNSLGKGVKSTINSLEKGVKLTINSLEKGVIH